MAKNIKIFNKMKEHLKRNKLKLITLSIAVGITLTGCSIDMDNNSNKPLDRSRIDTITTDGGDRADYYKTTVDDYFNELTKEEKEDYYVNVNVIYYGKEQYIGDNIIFLRNDNVYKGDIKNDDDNIKLTPGIYRVISVKDTAKDGMLGDIEILTPGEEVTLIIDYNNNTATLKEPTKTR